MRDPRNARNQPLMLSASACFRGAKGKLTCFTCHEPHADVQREACQGCHASVRHNRRSRERPARGVICRRRGTGTSCGS